MTEYYRFSCPICGNYNAYRLIQIHTGAELYCSVDTEEEHKFIVTKEIEDMVMKYLKKDRET